MTLAVGLALLSVLLYGPAGVVLERASWPSRAPRSAIALWQAIGLAGGLAAVGAGLAVAVAPLHLGLYSGIVHLVSQAASGHPLQGLGLNGALGLTLAADVGVVLAGGMVLTSWKIIRARARHRELLDLVSAPTDRAPGAVLLDHPQAAAYYLPGFRPRIVLSAGALGVLQNDELSAVVAHERGHLHERHDLVMLPFASMLPLLRWMPYVGRAPRAAATLVEMAADDFATRANEPHLLASALVHLASSDVTPRCALAASQTSVAIRVHRLLRPQRTSRWTAIAVAVSAVFVLALPMAALLAPAVSI